MKAKWNGQIIAKSKSTIVVEGNHYFPARSLLIEFFKPSDHTSVCGWKGTANYYNIEVNGKVNENAAWFYNTPSERAKHITGYVAFWNGVDIEEETL